jgi:copper oxidase (laccase) domain-containing protein
MSHELLAAALARAEVVQRERDGVRYLTYRALDELHGIRALTTLRKEAGNATPADEFLARLTPWLAQAFGTSTIGVVAGYQVHENHYAVVTAANRPRAGEVKRFADTDALMTREPGVALVVLTADCLPIFLACEEPRAVCIVHAGRVGTQKGIAALVARAFFDELGADPRRTLALIGPSIGDGCYPERLWEANLAQLREAGIPRIVHPHLCTRCNLGEFYSYRAEKGLAGRMASAIMIADA